MFNTLTPFLSRYGCVTLATVVALVAGTNPLAGQTPSADITASDLTAHVRILASDDFEGRGTGTSGNRKAAEYIVKNLQAFGLKPGGENGTFYQPFELVSDVKLGKDNTLALVAKGATPQAAAPQAAAVDVDFRPLGFSASAAATGMLVFAGYGISAPDQKYDDYAGIDVKGQIVLVLRYAPDGDSQKSAFSRHTSMRNKERAAREHGAAALVVITGPANDDADDLMKLRSDQTGGSAGIPVLSARRSLFAGAFADAGVNLKNLQDSVKADLKPRSFVFPGSEVRLSAEVVKIMAQSANVVGILEGTDPKLAGEVIVLGAHFDHLGFGGSGSMVPDTVAIHNGADDNASGTAGLLELAQKFAAEKNNRRTLVFAFFSGEEVGMLGSQHYVVKPSLPLAQTAAMVNLDMVGRMTDRVLNIGGTGTSPGFNGILAKENADSSFVLKLNPDGFGPSDHSSFYGKDIPVLFFWTGFHDDYHKPSDDWEKLNYPGEEAVIRYAYKVTRDIDQADARPTYARVESQASGRAGGDSRGFSVTLGIVPDFTEGSTVQGMKISGIRPNGPAEKAGLKTGDTITKMAGKAILGIYDYMGVLGELKAGQVVEVEYLRDNNAQKTMATMAKRN